MRIGIDVDEVLCRTNDYFLYEFNKKHKTNFMRDELTSYTYDCFKGFDGEYIFDCLIKHLNESSIFYDVLDSSKEVLLELKEMGHELFIITSRWKDLGEKTKLWIYKHFGEDFFKDILIYNDGSDRNIDKSQIAQEYNIDVLIEDAPKYALNTASKKIKVLLFNQPWNKNVPESEYITRVYSWNEIGVILSDFK